MANIYNIKSMTLNYDGGLSGQIYLRTFDVPEQPPPEPPMFIYGDKVAITSTNQPITVGPDPSNLFVTATDEETRIYQLHADGSSTVFAAYNHGTWRGLAARRASVRQNYGEIAWIEVVADLSSTVGVSSQVYGYRYQNGVLERSPAADLLHYLNDDFNMQSSSLISDGSEHVAIWAWQSSTNPLFLDLSWDGNPNNPPVLNYYMNFTETLEGPPELAMHGDKYMMLYKESGFPKVQRIPFPYNQNQPPEVIDVSFDTDYLGGERRGWLSGAVSGPNNTGERVWSTSIDNIDDDEFFTPILPDNTNFEGGLVRTVEWDDDVVMTFGIGEFNNAGEFIEGDSANLNGTNLVVYFNGEPLDYHHISTGATVFYRTHFFNHRPMRIGNKVWWVVHYQDSSGDGAWQFFQPFGYEIQ